MAGQRISVMTFNLWEDADGPANWPERRQPMIEVLSTYTPDILCVQEFHPAFQEVLCQALPNHHFIDDSFPGWHIEGNIFWNSTMFDKIEHGAIDIGMMEPSRRLFWALLKLKGSTDSQKILVTTAHYTWEGHPQERENDVNLRKQQARRTAAALQELKAKLNDPTLPILFMGDLNENYHPRRILRDAGYLDCFSSLRMVPPSTHPQRPSMPHEDILCDVALDWIMHNNYARPLLANVLKNLICSGGHSVSDHCPVMCFFEIGAGPYPCPVVQDFSGVYILPIVS